MCCGRSGCDGGDGAGLAEVIVIIGIYFSGTGNSRHCVETFVRRYDDACNAISIENPDIRQLLSDQELIVFGYPVYYSNIPKIVRDFIFNNKDCFQNKKIFIIATMGMLSGDGAGCAARILKKCGATIVGGLHLIMPDCIGDEKVLKKSLEAKKEAIEKANKKILMAVENLKSGNPPQNGLGAINQISGFLMQRLWFSQMTSSYKNKPKIDKEKCTGCGRCVSLCPMKNMDVVHGKAQANGKCTLCYRCFSHCPAKALTILGRQVHEQYLFVNCK